MLKRDVLLTLFAGLGFLLFTITGCGKERKVEEKVSYIGFTECYFCHSDSDDPSQPVIFGNMDVGEGKAGWLNGPHGNNESFDEMTHQKIDLYPDNTGFPFYDYFSDSSCATCHDPLGDGKKIYDFYISTGLNELGTVNRPVVGCESCHGGGSQHYGIGPIPYPAPAWDQCGSCHNENFPDSHLPYHPEGDMIAEYYSNSPHSESTYAAGSTSNVMAVCSRCHTDEGARQYISDVSGTDEHDTIVNIMEGKSNISSPSPVQCRTCHDAHNPLILLGEKASALPDDWSAEVKTCTSCHQLFSATKDTTYNTYTLLDKAYHSPYDKDGNVVNKYSNPDEIIGDTHFDDPSTPDIIEGYVINVSGTHSAMPGNENQGSCLDCHNPHNADTTINIEWARSGHGGHILEVKENADNVYTAGVTEEIASAWVHYDWKESNRQTCQRCHTATGFRNLANDPQNYDPANNIFVATGGQAELLYCWACHSSNTGELRNPGVFVLPGDSYIFPSGTTLPTDPTQDDYAAGSIICLNCHSGRSTGEYIKSLSFPYDGNFGSVNSHYLAAGGILYKTIGYEFDGRDYSNSSSFLHPKVGSGSNGPCVECHMRGEGNHLFSPVEKDKTGKITSIPANDKVCSKCHFNLSADELNEEREGYETALNALQAAVENIGGIYYCSNYPYFFNKPCDQNPGFPDAYTTWTSKEILGAAFNLNLLKHEPGAYVHNSKYTKRLIYDSIDYLYNNALDDDVETAVKDLATKGYSYFNSSMTEPVLNYLLDNGGRP